MNAKKTLKLIGCKRIHIQKSTSNTKRATLSPSQSPCWVIPSLLLSSSRAWRTAGSRKRILDLPHRHAIPDAKECMDGRVCNVFWVERILKPYVESAPEHVIPIIFLGSYRSHIMGSVVNAIRSLRCEVQHISGRCNGLCQPMDVGYNKSFKSQVCTIWVR